MKLIPHEIWEKLSPTEKQQVHETHVADARAYLETLMGEARLPEEAKQRLRRAFPGTDKGGIKQAVAIEKRMAARNRQGEGTI